jgi:hypothetical protein
LPAALVVGVVAAAVLIPAGNFHDPTLTVRTLAGAVAVRAR